MKKKSAFRRQQQKQKAAKERQRRRKLVQDAEKGFRYFEKAVLKLRESPEAVALLQRRSATALKRDLEKITARMTALAQEADECRKYSSGELKAPSGSSANFKAEMAKKSKKLCNELDRVENRRKLLRVIEEMLAHLH